MGEHAGLRWTKSSLSQNGDCVEWAGTADASWVYLRDSKHPSGPVLRFTRSEWNAFLAGVKSGEADL